MAKVEATTVESMKKTIQETLDAITAAIDSWNAQDHSMKIRAELRDWTTEHINDNKNATKFKTNQLIPIILKTIIAHFSIIIIISP